mmetsp:Transcript_67242/g.186277  ORF Transcript_67242/g.186277 Transcript_67242/m.186277 type:complete len:257 (-) Transcript_67242:1011-1781(-)
MYGDIRWTGSQCRKGSLSKTLRPFARTSPATVAEATTPIGAGRAERRAQRLAWELMRCITWASAGGRDDTGTKPDTTCGTAAATAGPGELLASTSAARACTVRGSPCSLESDVKESDDVPWSFGGLGVPALKLEQLKVFDPQLGGKSSLRKVLTSETRRLTCALMNWIMGPVSAFFSLATQFAKASKVISPERWMSTRRKAYSSTGRSRSMESSWFLKFSSPSYCCCSSSSVMLPSLSVSDFCHTLRSPNFTSSAA